MIGMHALVSLLGCAAAHNKPDSEPEQVGVDAATMPAVRQVQSLTDSIDIDCAIMEPSGQVACVGGLGAIPSVTTEGFSDIAVGQLVCGLSENGDSAVGALGCWTASVNWGDPSIDYAAWFDHVGGLYTEIEAVRGGLCGATAGGPIECWGAVPPPDFTEAVLSLPNRVSFGPSKCGLCVLTDDGTVTCEASYLDYDSRCEHPLGEGPYSSISTEGTLCGIKEDGTVHCFGGSNVYADNHGNYTSSEIFSTADPVGQTFTQVSATGSNACGVTSNGSVYCWTSGAQDCEQNNCDDYGQYWVTDDDLHLDGTYVSVTMGQGGQYLYAVDTDSVLHIRRPSDPEGTCGRSSCGPEMTFWDLYGLEEPRD